MKAPKVIKPLTYTELSQQVDLSELHFETTREISSFTKFIGQDRAWASLIFGIGMKSTGYNLYAMGPSGIGKRSLISTALFECARKAKTPNDWCYLYNFKLPEKPIAVSLPAGTGFILQQDMKSFIIEASSNILAILESEEYQINVKKIHHLFANTSKKTRKKINNKSESVLPLFPIYCKEKIKKEAKLQLTAVSTVIRPLIHKLKIKYKNQAAIIKYLNAVQYDITHHIEELIKRDEKTKMLSFSLDNPLLEKYKINLLVDNSQLSGAPVIFEDDPSYSTVICRIEYASESGVLSTNFTLIKPGSLHRANGGYLIIAARKLKKNQEAWEALKNALFSGEIKIRPIEHQSELYKPVSLEPMPIPLNIKVVLVGDRNTYYSLCKHDPDFLELFKVPVDFDEQIERNKKNIDTYARLIGTIAKRKKLRTFHVSAVATIIDYSSRLTEDKEKLSTHMRDIEDLMLEADYWANINKKKVISAKEVKQAIGNKIHRMDRARDLYYEDINRDFIIIKTNGVHIGQINCLSVRQVGNFSYGHPTRVTARVRLGRGKIIDIQREIKMAGPAHSKASLIISTFIASKFNQNKPFSLYASIAFEQIYCWTDGDSASVGELCALLSALANVPIRQDLSVTGSIDQYGLVQAIGGVNEKIEGFYDICNAKGLTGTQGVLIPAVNKKNLMLREDVVLAAKAKKFHIYTIRNINEAIYLLTGLPSGKRDQKGQFTPNSLYYLIENKLQLFTNNRSNRNPLD